MPDADTNFQPQAGPSRHRSIPLSPSIPSSDRPGEGSHPTTAQPLNPLPQPLWRAHYRPDSPYPHCGRTPLRRPHTDRPESDEEAENDSGSGGLADDQDSPPAYEGEVSSMVGSPEWDRVGGHREVPGPTEQMLEYYGPKEDIQVGRSESSISLGRSPAANPLNLADHNSQHSLVSTASRPQREHDNDNASQPPNRLIQSEVCSPGDQPPPLQREQSRVTNVSMSTNIETPAHPSVPLPGEPPISLAQQVWRHRKIRKRIMSHMDTATVATMCRVNQRMYEQAIHFLAHTMDLLTVVKTLDRMPRTRNAWKSRAFLGSVRQLEVRHGHASFGWSEFRQLCPRLRTIEFFALTPEGNLVIETILHKQTRISRYGRRTIIVCHTQNRDINVLHAWPHLKPPIDITPDYLIIHRYQFCADSPHLHSTAPNGRINDFSPLGDHIAGITMENPMAFSFAYEQLKRCVEKRRCPRGFTWSQVRLHLWRMTISELRMMLELLQADHLTIGNLVINTDFRDKGTMSTQEFVKAGPSLWRLLGKFKNVSLTFRHENEPMPMPGKGPKGLSAFSKNEPLNLVSLLICGALPSTGPIDIWKFSFKYIYAAFFRALLSPNAEFYNAIVSESVQHDDPERTKLFNTADLRIMWDTFRRSVKSITTFAFMWEWEHGSVAPKKVPPPGWRKMKEKEAKP